MQIFIVQMTSLTKSLQAFFLINEDKEAVVCQKKLKTVKKNIPLGQTVTEDTIINSTASADTKSERISLVLGLWGTLCEIKPCQVLVLCSLIYVVIRTDLTLESFQRSIEIFANVCLCLSSSCLNCHGLRNLLGTSHTVLPLCVQATGLSCGDEIQFKRKYLMSGEYTQYK